VFKEKGIRTVLNLQEAGEVKKNRFSILIVVMVLFQLLGLVIGQKHSLATGFMFSIKAGRI